MARWYQAPQQAALHQTFGPFPPPDRFEAWPGFVPVTNAFMDAEDGTAPTSGCRRRRPCRRNRRPRRSGWATRGLRRVMSWRDGVHDAGTPPINATHLRPGSAAAPLDTASTATRIRSSSVPCATRARCKSSASITSPRGPPPGPGSARGRPPRPRATRVARVRPREQ